MYVHTSEILRSYISLIRYAEFCVFKYFFMFCASEVYGQFLRHMLATMVCYCNLKLDPFLTQLDCFQHTLRVSTTVLYNNLVFADLEYY